LLAAAWNTLSPAGRARMPGMAFSIFGRELHTTSFITGVISVAVGVLFWVSNGLVTMPELLPAGVSAWLQENTAFLSNPVVDILLLATVIGIILAVWIRARYRRANAEAAHVHESA